MKSTSLPRLLLWLAFFCVATCPNAAILFSEDGYHVYPGDEIQDALNLAAANSTNKTIHVHAGEYRPTTKRQALIWLNRRHEGIHLLAEGDVTLTARNPLLGLPSEDGFPAAVNHVIYLGDGISSNTIVQGFKVTGANGFLTRERTREMEPSTTIPRNFFFYSDGGGIKVFGRSSPVLRNLEIIDNFTKPCGAGISIQNQGFKEDATVIENCIFRNNRAQGTGAAVDLLAGSAARITNCLFTGNTSNTGEDMVAKNSGERPFVNNGVVTIFWKSTAVFKNCTFAGNRNGVDDMGGESTYINCIFYQNNSDTGLKGYPRYELAVNAGAKVTGCRFSGTVIDIRHDVSPTSNQLTATPPQFDSQYRPGSPGYEGVGYFPSASR
jgi:hypothetical protein